MGKGGNKGAKERRKWAVKRKKAHFNKPEKDISQTKFCRSGIYLRKKVAAV